jgi:hypothetical protein
MLNFTKRVFDNNSEAVTDTYNRTEKLGNLVLKLQKVIEDMQEPAGCNQSQEEKNRVKEIINNAIKTVGDSMEDFKKNLPEGVIEWMDQAKTVLMQFSDKINNQPTEEDMKALIKALKIEDLQEIVQNAQESAAVDDKEKANMLKVQKIVAPLQKVTDQESFFTILAEEVVPAMSDNLSSEKIDAFVETANKWLDDIPGVVSYIQCQAKKSGL